ncbi:glutathione S-transferase family protein [Candidatus Hydrogenosomobacter endosymbioticus]|nr:glutathione S-transferase family protein [Candidatus Hydrogenosomobacter endosymbioticus]
MRVLYSASFCPLSRKLAFGLREKKIEFSEKQEVLSAPSRELLSANPGGDIPSFVDHSVVCGSDYVACEYIDEAYPSPVLMGESPKNRAEVRRILHTFDSGFYQDVYLTLFYEKALKRMFEKNCPDTKVIKEAKSSLNRYMDFLNQLADARKFLAGSFFSWADISAASQVSCIDYIGDIQWNIHPHAKIWYMKIKSRPSFRQFLSQSFAGVPAVSWYRELDF